MNTIVNSPSSLFDDGQIGADYPAMQSLETNPTCMNSLVDLLHDGFYIVFLLKNHYVPTTIESFREKILEMLNHFEHQARQMQFSIEDIQDAKYAYCALIDETIVTQQDEKFFDLQNAWMISPLQLSLFGSQLAGFRFFEHLEEIRHKDKQRLAVLEVYHYCLLLGFHGKYRIESIEHLNSLIARIGDQIDYLKGKKTAFSPFAAIPDQIRHIIHRELPFFWILIFLLLFAVISFVVFKYALSTEQAAAFSQYQNLINAPAEQAYITIHLP
ncbi:type IVB secretion system protein IcmH/DotU [Acinetobacter lwoffii]|uniref:type IVB secretion system protein IcmH/DotU n=1 Tax=Acinetobacter lwoffii TaxID=28090 RepID=UPI00209BA206|nr:type IVB secretion system protein IcmH/DotU [Acinetobacter lwoffii]MCO8079988.1 type IVB secretion system protein IcmH/DotU [Acinetobacter lwoffii]